MVDAPMAKEKFGLRTNKNQKIMEFDWRTGSDRELDALAATVEFG